MITVHNLTKSGVAKPIRSTIINDSHMSDKKAQPDSAIEGWQAYSGKSTITWPHPTAVNEDVTKTAGELKDANMDMVNRARYVELAIGTGTDDLNRVVAQTGATYLLSASAFGNWRKKSINGFSDISERLLLSTEKRPEASYSIQYATGSAKDAVLKNNLAKTVSKISDAVNTFAATGGALVGGKGGKEVMAATITGERASLYKDFPLMKASESTTTASIGDSVKFDFKFGQAGIYSGEEEVVKPILALVGPWALKTGNYHSVSGPFPTFSQASRIALLKTIDIIGGNSSLLQQDTKSLEGNGNLIAGAVRKFNSVTDKLYGLIDEVAQACFSTCTTMTFVVGGLVVGPFFPTKIDWSFDFDNVDEFGYPCEGSITFGGLTPVRLYTNSDYARQWGYGVATTTDANPAQKAQIAEQSLDKESFAAEASGAVDDGLKTAR